MSPVILFRLKTLKGTPKAPAVDLETEHPNRYENRFLTPKRYDKHPSSFYMGWRLNKSHYLTYMYNYLITVSQWSSK